MKTIHVQQQKCIQSLSSLPIAAQMSAKLYPVVGYTRIFVGGQRFCPEKNLIVLLGTDEFLKKSWKSYPVRVLRSFASYEKAATRLPRALIESNIESQSCIQSSNSSYDEEPIIKKKWKKDTSTPIAIKPSKNTLASSWENCTLIATRSKQPSDIITPTGTPSSRSDLSASCSNHHNLVSTVTKNDTTLAGTPSSSSTQSVNSPFELKVIELLTSLREEQRENKILIQELLRNSRRSVINLLDKPEGFPMLPCQNIEEFEYLENQLKTDSTFDYMRQFLISLGGSNAQVSTRKMLKQTISNEIGQEFNWKGRGKRPFQATKLKEVIFDSVKRNNPGATGHDIASVVKDWLKYSKARINSQKRTL